MTLTKEEIYRIAREQSAKDANCSAEDFVRKENVIVTSRVNPEARRYLKLPLSCNLISYGDNIVASVSEPFREAVEAYISRYPIEHIFETPAMHILNAALESMGERICFMAEYFLPDPELLRILDCPYECRVLHAEDFAPLYIPEWSNALCRDRSELDVLGVGAYDVDRLIGLAACSADCDTMWQIGVDVLPAYRRQGVASCLTSRLARLILDQGRVPFYCCAWSNLKSAGNALKCGFRPAWTEMTAKPIEFVEEMNR